MRLLANAGASGLALPGFEHRRARAASAPGAEYYHLPLFGNARLVHFTDCHAQLLPSFFREPNVNLGIGNARGKPPHLVGDALLAHFGIEPGSRAAHAYSYLGYMEAARRYGAVGGFAHLATLIKGLRGAAGEGRSLLLDGGDTWQGSGTAFWTRGQDMVGASNRLGVDVMTGHWEFTYQESEVLANVEAFTGEFLAQNIRVKEDALFEGVSAYDEDTGHAFKPYTVKEVGGARIAVIGQAFPYTPIANPARFIPNWTFGIRDDAMQALVDQIRGQERPAAVVLLSHNGMDVDLKLATRVRGIDAILGGHTHDGVPSPSLVANAGGKTLVTNAGCNGKFVAVLDMDLTYGSLRDFRYRLLPVFSNLLEPDPAMSSYIEKVRAPHRETLSEELATAESLLYRRGNFNGTFDQVICDALRQVSDAQIALSPGFRWGTTVLPGEPISMENLLDQTCITYPETYVRDMSGAELKLILEDVADNLFNPDPYYQQGGDMVRVGGLSYRIDPAATIGGRISDLTLADGSTLEAGKRYRVAGWATVGTESPGAPVWEVVAEYLRARKSVRIERLETPTIVGVAGNPGIADYAGDIV
jgi:sulfur-oxidizing protein SoxB